MASRRKPARKPDPDPCPKCGITYRDPAVRCPITHGDMYRALWYGSGQRPSDGRVLAALGRAKREICDEHIARCEGPEDTSRVRRPATDVAAFVDGYSLSGRPLSTPASELVPASARPATAPTVPPMASPAPVAIVVARPPVVVRPIIRAGNVVTRLDCCSDPGWHRFCRTCGRQLSPLAPAPVRGYALPAREATVYAPSRAA